ncbi:MAG: NosD domain-containing protein, partial [Thermoplasmata archaeon]
MVYNNTIMDCTCGISIKTTFYGNISANLITRHSESGVHIYNSSFCNITNNTFSSSNIGLELYESTNNTILGNNITTTHAKGIYFHEISNDNFVSRNNIFSNYGDGIVLDGSKNNTIYNNTILSNSGEHGIILYYSSKNNISSNVIKSNTKNGVYIEHSELNNIEMNDIEDNGVGYGIYVANAIQNYVINNIIMNNGYGINFISSQNNSIISNTIIYNGYGINFISSQNNSIISNTIMNNGDGIIFTSSQNNVLENNHLSSNGGWNFKIEFSQNISIYNNTIFGGDITAGISVYSSENCKIINNTVSGPFGIFVWGSSNFIEINLNNISYCTNYGIKTFNTHNLSIVSNEFYMNTCALYIEESRDLTIESNIIYNNLVGIYVYNVSSNLKILNNEIYLSNIGINVNISEHCIIDGNYIHNCNSPIILSFSENNTIANNSIYNSIDGIHLIDSSHNSIIYNYIVNTSGTSNKGICLEEKSDNTYLAFNLIQNYARGMYILSSNNTVCNNIFISNSYGMYLYNSRNNTISFNRIAQSSNYGMYLTSSIDNIIHHNSFISNLGTTSQAFDNGNNLWNQDTKGNYWDNWTSPDFNNDGIVDTPYNIDGGFNRDEYPLTYSPAMGIRINNDNEFTPANGVVSGNGSISDPYIIEGWNIDGTPFGYCIYIGNTTKYFIIRNCTLMNTIDGNAIAFVNVTHGLVYNCTIFNCKYAINISSGSTNISIIKNTIYSCENGIYSPLFPLPQPQIRYINISENSINCTQNGINLTRLVDSIIYNNTFITPTTSAVGLTLSSGADNLISKNSFNSTFDIGIRLVLTNRVRVENNTISSNNITNNIEKAIEIRGASNITIFNNSITYSNIGIRICQSALPQTESSDIKIIDCRMYNTNTAIDISFSSQIYAINNTIFSSETGIKIWSSSTFIESNRINCTHNCIDGTLANYCVISNNTLFIYNPTVPPAAINLIISSHTVIYNNTFTLSAGWAIRLVDSTYNTIEKNNISDSPNGIALVTNSDNNVVLFNILQNYENYGIFIYNSNQNTIDNNTVTSKVGIYLDSSDGDTISSNIIYSNSQYGIEIRNGIHHTIYNNNITNNDLGILINQSTYIYVLECNLSNNPQGINASDSLNCSFANNTIKNSDIGIYLHNCFANLIHHNIFSNNSLHAYDNGNNFWNNTIGGNYWDNWTIPDRNAPFGIVDIPLLIDGGAIDYLPLTTYIGNPFAQIVSITPIQPTYPENITFVGYGYCDGLAIVSYNWSCNETGFLSAQANFNITLYGGIYNISFSVMSSDGRWSDPVYITITVNQAKPIAYIECSSTSVEEGTTIYLNGSGTDIDGYIVEYRWTINADMLSNEQNLAINTLPVGDNIILLSVMDNNGSWSEPTSVVVTITPHINNPPTANIISITPSIPVVGQSVIFQGIGNDSDGYIVEYNWSSNITGWLGNSSSITINNLTEGTHTIFFSVMDNEGAWSAPVTCNLTIRPQPPLPIAQIISVFPNVTQQGETVYFIGQGSDPEGTIIGYEWQSNIDGTLSNSASFNTSSLSVGTHNITFRVENNNGVWSHEVYVIVIVNPVSGTNIKPIATILSITPNRATFGEVITFNGSGSDPDGYVIGYRWISNITGEIGSTATFSTSSLPIGTHRIQLFVIDNNNSWSEPSEMTLIIYPNIIANKPPNASIVSIPSEAYFGEVVTLIGSGTDEDGYIVAFNWTSSLMGFLGSNSTLNLTNLTIGVHTISLSVMDNNGSWSNIVNASIVIKSQQTSNS